MKKLFSLILVAVAALLCGVNASAYQLTFNVADPESVELKIGEEVYPLTNAGANVVEFSLAEGAFYVEISLTAKDGWVLKSVEKANDETNGYFYIYGAVASMYFYTNYDGGEFNVVTEDVREARTATLTVIVPDAVSENGVVNLTCNRNGIPVTLQNGTNEIKFIPDSYEANFVFRNAQYKPFYEITCNGTPVASQEYAVNAYDVVAKDGDVVNIQVKFPEMKVPVTFVQNHDDIITSVSVDYEQVDWKAEDFSVQAGATMFVNFNTDKYKITSILVNGEAKQGNYLNIEVPATPLTIAVTGDEYADINFTVNVEDPATLLMYRGTSSYGTRIELVAGANALTVKESNPYVYFEAVEDYYIKTVTDADGNAVELSYGSLQVSEGMDLTVVTAKIEMDSKFVVYYTGEPSAYANATINSVRYPLNDESEYYAGDYYWVFPFCSGLNSGRLSFDANPNWDDSKNGLNIYLYYNGTGRFDSYIQETVSYTDNYVYYAILVNGTEAPAEHTISITADEDAADAVKVVRDIIVPVEDWSAGVKAFEGTKLAVTIPEGYTMKFDEEELTLDEDFTYSFKVTADHTIIITKTETSSAINIDAAESEQTIYNLQGIKVNNDMSKLPSGIYIVNGKKVRK